MTTRNGNQRWNGGRATYRRPTEVIRTAAYDVAEIDRDVAKAFVVEHHYSRCFPAARFQFGLHERGELVGVAVFSHPMSDAVITNALEVDDATEGTELGRFVLLDRVPGNGETWFLARCLAALAGRVRGVVSFSDPVPRTGAGGELLFPGHIGTIYQAANARYRGLTKPSTIRLFPDGRVFSNRAAGKIARRERGHEAVARELERWGAAPLAVGEDALEWLRRWRPLVTRTLRHSGNHRYVWPVGRRNRAVVRGTDYPYPKRRTPAQLSISV